MNDACTQPRGALPADTPPAASGMPRRGLWSLVLLIFWVATFYPVFPEMVSKWLNDPDNAYGILVPFVSAYLMYQKREVLRRALPSGSPWGLALLAASLVCYIVAYAGHVAVVARATAVASLIGLVLYNWGPAVLRAAGFPLAFLFFMVPVPDSIYGSIAFPLQLFASKISVFLIELTSIPVYREGNMLYFTQTQLEVAEACSGLRSVASLAMLAVLFAHLLRGGRIKRALLVVSSVPLAMLMNIVRVTGTGILGHFCGDDVARGFLHEFSGMAVFALGFLCLALEFAVLNRHGGDDRVTKTHP